MAKVGLNLGLNRCLQTTKNHKIKKVATFVATSFRERKTGLYAFFADGFEEIEALTAVDTLRRAGLNVEIVSVTPDEIVVRCV